ncbi:MAG: hypothetical protein ACRYFU_11340 [Janthinobacterium lividum]
MIRSSKFLFAACVAMSAVGAAAQTKLDRQLSYFDLGIQGVGQFTSSTSGTINYPGAFDQGTVATQTASTSLGALITLRYTPKPYLGAEFNGGYARYAETYNVNPLQVQTQANELTVGYVITPPYTIFGVKPYASAGGGAVRFAPTAGGGEETYTQARGAYYYNLGVQKEVFGNHLGLRLGFRQVFFLAPDFQENYLALNKRVSTAEPMVGFYLHY